MSDFSRFDQRGYRVVSVREGYRDWVSTYEETVEDLMDLALLERISTVDWAAATRVADLGCGTGRTGAWLAGQGASALHGVDLTVEMMELARLRGVYERLDERDVRETGLDGGAYPLVVCCLVDEHLPEVDSLYREAGRLLLTGGRFVLVGYHPFFSMARGMPTHFDHPDGEPVAIDTHVHLPGEHVAAGLAAGLSLIEMHEGRIDDSWIECKPKWEAMREWPISFCQVWRKD